MDRRLVRSLLFLIVLVAWTLALLRLGERSLWADEGYTGFSAREVASQGFSATMHQFSDASPLHLVLMMAVVRLDGSELVLRLPSALSAVLCVAIVFVLGRRLLGTTAGLIGAFLLSISPFAIGYAQEARTYALLQMLACLSLLLLLRAMQNRDWLSWAAYVASASLVTYAHYFGWLVVTAQFLGAGALGLWRTVKERHVDVRLGYLALSLVAVAAFYLPWLPIALDFWRNFGPEANAAQTAGLRTFRLSLDFFLNMLVVFGARSHGWQSYLFGGAFVLGLLDLTLRRRQHTVLLLALWFGVPVVALTAVSSSHFFDHRYLIFVLPLFLLAVGQGVAWVASRLPNVFPAPFRQRAQPALALGFAALLFVPANLPALVRDYHSEKENWRAIARFVGDNLLPGDALYVSPRYWSYPLLYYRPDLQNRVLGGSSTDLDQLVTASKRQPGLWFIRYGGPLGDPTGSLNAWIADQGFELLFDADACGWGIDVYYGRSDERARARQSELLAEAQKSCPSDPRFGGER